MSRNFFALMATTCLGSLAIAPAAWAQDAADDAKDKDEIVVTGTQIRGIAPVGSETFTVTPEQIKESGGRTVNDVLSTIPQFTNLFNRTVVGVPNQSRQVVQPQIHGLDTLILLDGRRLASAGVGNGGSATSIDPSIIPTGVLGGIEVLADGGSALYGSDAVGGVVNMTTLKKFDGVSVDGSVTLGKAYKAFTGNLTAGKAWETGSAYVSYAYNKVNAVLGFDRPFIRRNPLNNSCYPATVFARNGNTVLNRYSYAGVDASGRPTGYTLGAASCNRHTFESIIPDEHMHSIFGGVTQELGSSIRVDLRAFWSQRKSVSYTAVGLNSDSNSGTVIPKTNPFYTPTPEEVITPARTQGVNLTLAPAVGNNLPSKANLKNWGVSGEIAADVFSDFQVRLLGNYNESRINTLAFDSMDTVRFGQALAGNVAGVNALNPYNVAFSPESILVAQQIANRSAVRSGRTKQTQVRLVMDGTLFAIPGGDVKIALGGEYLRERYNAVGDVLNYLAVASATDHYEIAAPRTVKSAFGELNVPVISPENDGPIHSLNLSAAGRYDHYSDFGGKFNPRFAATLQPAEWVTLRATYGKSFLAPSLPQLFAAQTVQRSTAGFILPPGATNVLLVLGGNRNLKPQKARTWSLGLELKDPSNEGPRVSLTYYNVSYQDKLGNAASPFQSGGGNFYTAQFQNFWIKDPTYEQALAFINSSLSPVPLIGFAGGTTVDSLYEADRSRNANSPSYIASNQIGNIAREKTEGLDFDVGYKYPTSFGALDFRLGGNFIIERDGAQDGVNFTDALLTEPNFRGSFSVAADVGNFRTSLSLLHTSGRGISGINNASGQMYAGTFNTVNTFFSYTFKEDGILADTVLSLQINNVFDVLPPVNLQASTGYDNGDLIGRSFQIGLRKKF